MDGRKMDLKEIIKWFIPCFHILLGVWSKMDGKMAVVYLFLFFNFCPSSAAKVPSVHGVGLSGNSLENAKNVDLYDGLDSVKLNQSDVEQYSEDPIGSRDVSVGRTFGRPFKKMVAALIPLVFQIGAASTWAVVAALVGVKTLVVTLAILKILLVAGAAKFGALLASKGHQQHGQHGWQQPHKEIHLHIHGGHHATGEPAHEEHLAGPWSRHEVEPEKSYSMVVNPYLYSAPAGPQTIRTPYGNYIKVD